MIHTQAAEYSADRRSRLREGSPVYLVALLVSLLGLAYSFIACYPGVMTWDSFVMWGMGWIWPWHDWHSPYIALLMGVSRRLFGDPSARLFLQLLLSWGGLYFTACGLRRHSRRGAALLPLLGLTPMFLVFSGFLHKTPLQAAVFLFVFGVLYYYHRWGETLPAAWMLPLMILLLFAIPLREFGILCALPIIAFLFYCRLRRTGTSWVAGYLLAAVVVAGGSLAGHQVIVYHVLHALKLHKIQTLYRYDLAAIYALTGVDFAPRMIRDRYRSHASMRDLYEHHRGMWRIMYAYEGGIPRGYAIPKDIPERSVTDSEIAYYRAAWLEALGHYPATWLAHKWHGFCASLGLGVKLQGFRRAREYRSRQNVFGLKKGRGVLPRSLGAYMRRVDGTLLLKPWLWLIVTVVLLVLGSWMYQGHAVSRDALIPIFVLLASASLFYPQLFLIGLDNDLRFSYWAIVSGALASYLFLATVWSEDKLLSLKRSGRR